MDVHSRFSGLVRTITVVVCAVTVGACGGGGSGSTTANTRPTSTARVTITSPAPNATTGPDVTVTVQLSGGKLVPQSSGKLVGDQGHLHLSVDEKLVSMTNGLTQQVTALTPGLHTVKVEYVAIDHGFFAVRVIDQVVFTVQ